MNFEGMHKFEALSGKYMIKPAVVDGNVIENYYVCFEGNLFSSKRSNYLKKLRFSIAGNSPYPKISITENGKPRTLLLHRVVCETYHEFPTRIGISESDWKRTPRAVKALMRGLFQVNHIDEQHANYHPSNLEWVTVKQNARKHQELKMKAV